MKGYPLPARPVFSTVIGDQTVVWSAWKSQVFVLSDSGSVIWKHLDGRHTAAQIAEALCAIFRAKDRPGVERDVAAFLDQLTARGLIAWREDGQKLVEPGHSGRAVMVDCLCTMQVGEKEGTGQSLWLRIGGVTILLRSETLALARLQELYDQFVVSPGVADLVLDVSVSPWQEQGPASWSDNGRDRWLSIVAAYYGRFFQGVMNAEELKDYIELRLDWTARYLPVPGFKSALEQLQSGSEERPVDLVFFQRPGRRGGALFLGRGPACWCGKAFMPAENSSEATLRVFSYYLSLAIGRLLQEQNALLLHASAVLKDSKVYLFVGPGGSGKTTIAKKSGAYQVLADDGIVVRQDEKSGDFVAFATPWNLLEPAWLGRFGKSRPSGIINRIFFLKQAGAQSFERLDLVQSVARLGSQVVFPYSLYENQGQEKVLDRFMALCHRIPCYEMRFALEGDIWAGIDLLDRDAG